MDYQSIPIPTSSPWGSVQGGEEIAPGIVSVWTSSHGGILLSSERLKAMPEALKRIGERSAYHSGQGWFEEDCEWSAVALAFPAAFEFDDERRSSRNYAEIARATMARYYPHNLAEFDSRSTEA